LKSLDANAKKKDAAASRSKLEASCLFLVFTLAYQTGGGACLAIMIWCQHAQVRSCSSCSSGFFFSKKLTVRNVMQADLEATPRAY